ncbi:protein phosphatase 1G isoform X1 [Ictalurus punctatus]|uniref:Protein phosphatase 1G n=2 Tax=Ictalurus punctatus TaxID=7998 RepID=A0A2D0QME6_ICTPU|nr:protein phosphatase 1G isoform X1 [Ictalurus punctatus]
MGAYLSKPSTEKSTADGGNQKLSYGFAAMQGWRVSMEDAHNCIPELDEETAMFAVYDGHGGEEVALYCSKYLPDIIKEQKAYKDGKLQKALEDAFLAIDSLITSAEVIKELVQIAGRPQEEAAPEKVAYEDDVDNEETALLHEEATMTIEELLVRYGQNLNKSSKKPGQDAPKELEDKDNAHADKGINGETECGASETDSNGKAKLEETAGGSKMRACRRAAASSGSSAAGHSSEHEKAGATADAGPSCSSSAAPTQGSAKSKFFEDSDESDEGEDEEEGSDEEDCSEQEGEDSSENEEDDTDEEEEEDTEEEEEMCLPGMDGKEEPGSDSGTTAVVALIRGKQLIVANAGDSRCVVSERGKAVDMSYDHKPEDELELARIKNAGGKVTMDGRVNGGLNLSRAIGDHFYKRNKNLPPEEQMISALPDVKVLTLNEEHEFMVVACDGIWNVMSSQEVVDFVNEKLKAEGNENKPLSAVIEELLDHCLAPDTSGDGTGCDNMTCMIVRFSPHTGTYMDENTKKRKPEEQVSEENGNDSKKSKTE